MSSLSGLMQIEVTQDDRTLQEIFSRVRRQRKYSQEYLQDIVNRESTLTVQRPGQVHRIGIVPQYKFSPGPGTVRSLIRIAEEEHNLQRFPLVVALLIAEKYHLHDLGCDFLIFAHHWAHLPRPSNPGKSRRYVLGITGSDKLFAYREQRDLISHQADFAFAMPSS